MVNADYINDLLRPRINRILLVAETALPPNQFQAYRKIILDELGKSGLGKDIEKVFRGNKAWNGQERD